MPSAFSRFSQAGHLAFAATSAAGVARGKGAATRLRPRARSDRVGAEAREVAPGPSLLTGPEACPGQRDLRFFEATLRSLVGSSGSACRASVPECLRHRAGAGAEGPICSRSVLWPAGAWLAVRQPAAAMRARPRQVATTAPSHSPAGPAVAVRATPRGGSGSVVAGCSARRSCRRLPGISGKGQRIRQEESTAVPAAAGGAGLARPVRGLPTAARG